MKIVILDAEKANPGDLSWAPIQALGECTVYSDSRPDQIVERIGDAQAVIVNKVEVSGKTMAACPHLNYIGLLSTGTNVVDLSAAKERGITVCNVPGYSTASVAQHTFALLLDLCNHVALHSQRVKEGGWNPQSGWCFWEESLTELSGKTFGCIGFGSIGKASGRIAKAMGMNVLATGSRPTPEGEAIAQYVDLDSLLAQSDVISLHCPLTPDNKEIISQKNIKKMKEGVFLLNTARGGLVNEQDLADALASGKIRAAGVDVTASEPIAPDSPLLQADHCIITPHIAWAPKETRARLLEIVAANLNGFLQGTPQNVVPL